MGNLCSTDDATKRSGDKAGDVDANAARGAASKAATASTTPGVSGATAPGGGAAATATNAVTPRTDAAAAAAARAAAHHNEAGTADANKAPGAGVADTANKNAAAATAAAAAGAASPGGGASPVSAVGLPGGAAAPGAVAAGNLVPQEFAYVRDIVAEFAKLDPSLRRRVRIETEFAYFDPSLGRLVEKPADAPTAATADDCFVSATSSGARCVRLRKSSVIINDDARLSRTTIDVATRLLKARAKMASSAYFKQPLVMLFDDALGQTDAQHQKYTGLPTIATADRSQDLAGAHALVASLELLLADAVRFIVEQPSLWRVGADEDGGTNSAYAAAAATVPATGGAADKYAAGNRVTMDTITEAVSASLFSASSLWASVPDPATGGSAAATGSSAAAPAVLRARLASSVEMCVRLLFLSLGAAEYVCSPNEHGVAALPALDVLVALLVRQTAPLLKAARVDRVKLRAEVCKWMRLLAHIGIVTAAWDSQAAAVNTQCGFGAPPSPSSSKQIAGPAANSASLFAQFPVFLLTPTATAQLLHIDLALRIIDDRRPPALRASTTAQSEVLDMLTRDGVVPSTLNLLRPTKYATPGVSAHRLADVPTRSPPVSPNDIPFGARVPAVVAGEPAVVCVPSASAFAVQPAAAVSAFFDTVSKPYFGSDARFGVRGAASLNLHRLFGDIALEYCAYHAQVTEFDALFSNREYDPNEQGPIGNNSGGGAGGGGGGAGGGGPEQLALARIVMQAATDKVAFVQMATVDEGDSVQLDGETYAVLQREFRTTDSDDVAAGAGDGGGGGDGGMPHAIFNATTSASGSSGSDSGGKPPKSVVLHLRLPFTAPPLSAKRETLPASRPVDVTPHYCRCLFAAPSVDYATFVVSNQLQVAADDGSGGAGVDALLDVSNDARGMTALIDKATNDSAGQRSHDDTLRQQQSAYLLGWLIGSAVASGVVLSVPLPALMFRVMKTFARKVGSNAGAGAGDDGEDTTHQCLFQASEADVVEMMPRISAVVDDIRRLSTMRFIDLVRMEGLGSIMTKDEYITSIIAEPIVLPLTSYPVYEAIFTGLHDSGLCQSPLWRWSSALTQQRVVTAVCLEDDDRNAPDFLTRDWDIRVGFMPFAPDALQLEEKFASIIERVVATLSPMHKRELLRKSLGLLRPPAGSDHVFSVSIAVGSLELENGPSPNDFDEEVHETPFVRPSDNILRFPNYLEATLFRSNGLYWQWFPARKATGENTTVAPELIDNALGELSEKQLAALEEAVAKLTAERAAEFLIPPMRHEVPRSPADNEMAASPLEPM